MTDEQIATQLHEAAGRFNHFVHVAKYHGMSVWFDWIDTDGPAPGRIKNLIVARIVAPSTVAASEPPPPETEKP